MLLVCASANPDKVAEIEAILHDSGIELLPRPDSVPDVVEDAESLEGNARLKARALCDATGIAAVADDTGLEVEALGGAPGVRSARFAGDEATYVDNVMKLLDALSDLPEPEERARAASAPSPSRRFPTVVRSWPTARWKGRSPSDLAATTASATTPSSCRTTAMGERSPRCQRTRSTRSATGDARSARWRTV